MITRIITGLVLIGIGVTVINLGGLPLFAWVAVVSILCAYELINMAKKADIKTYEPVVYGVVGLSLASLLTPVGLIIWKSFPVLVVVSSVVLLAFYELKKKKVFFPRSKALATLRIILFVSGTFPFVFLVREGQNGFVNFLFAVVLIWVCDIAALFGGRAFGRTPLSALSPKKTVEGSVIGFFVSLIAAGIIIHCCHLPTLPYLILGSCVVIISQIGDLHESLVKRFFGVKDSSNILPGHGGIYDRADSTMFVMPLLFYFFN